MQLQGKKIVITGGSDGLGLALAKACSAKGAQVIILGRNQEKLDKAVFKLGKQSQGFMADVSRFANLEKVAAEIGPIDVLINNAGVWIEGNIETNSEADISQAIDINLKGVIYSTKAFLGQLNHGEETQIINISSTSGIRTKENQAVYCASKYGVQGFTEALKMDLAKSTIKVTGFYPGGMSTELFAKAGAPKENSDWMSPDKVAAVVIFMLEQDVTMIMDHVIVNKRMAKTSN